MTYGFVLLLTGFLVYLLVRSTMRHKQAQEKIAQQVEELDIQRLAALKLAQDAEQARLEAQQAREKIDQQVEELNAQRLAALNLAKEAVEARRKAVEAQAEVTAKSKDLETLLYVTSHDLKEPLRAIDGFSRMVHERYAARLDAKGQDFLKRIMHGAQRMDALINDIVALSHAQRLEPPTVAIDGEAIVEEAVQGLDARIKECGAKVQIAKDLPRLYVEKTWATQAIYNLVANALKFIREGEAPDIEIAPYRSDGQVGIVVRDRGPGVAPEHAERIFQLFQRAVGREIEGTGAGLAIVRQVAERHQGRAWVQPREGGGSEFVITFGEPRVS